MKKILILLCCLGLLYERANANEIIVSNQKELSKANAEAKPGDVIVLKNGIWNDVQIKLTCNGSNTKPIIIKAEKNGAVIIKGKSNLQIGGSYITVEGLLFTEGSAGDKSVWEFKSGGAVSNNCRLTNCVINSFNNENRLDENYWISLYGKNNRIDHCTFLNKTNFGVLIAVILDDDRSRMNNHIIDSNYFGARKPLGANTGEIIRVGVSQHCTYYSNTVIQNNLFEHCDGEVEIVSIKSCGNAVRSNVFKECQGSVVLRHGNNNTVEGNMFLGNGKDGTGGVRIINEGNWVVNNLFYECKGKGFRTPLTIMNGVFNSPPNRYLPVKDALVANNTFINCNPFSLGEGADKERGVAPANTFIINNIFYNDKETTLFKANSSIDSIYFINNEISKQLNNQLIVGLKNAKISCQKLNDAQFAKSKTNTNISTIPNSFIEQQASRLKFGFPKKIGSSNIQYFKNLNASANKLGADWNKAISKTANENTNVNNCADAAAVYTSIANNKTNTTINLTGDVYEFEKPITISNNVKIIGQNKKIVFQSSSKLNTLFQFSTGSMLELKNVQVDASALKIDNFLQADSNCIHYSLRINESTFTNFAATNFLNAQKSSYADAIDITNSNFNSFNSNIISMKDELDNKGFYNVERMNFTKNSFENINGFLLDVYRGGNDESTMGPILNISNNTIVNCNYAAELLKLYGVQQSVVNNNSFKNSNVANAVLSYTDITNATHESKNNTLENSGTIIENQFVNNKN